jgi:hypothetical protein
MMLLCSTVRLNEERGWLRRVGKGVVDPCGEEALETGERLAVGESVLLAAGHVGFGGLIGSALGHGGAIDDGVEFAVAETTEAVPGLASGGGLDGRGPGVGGEMSFGAKDALADKANDLASREGAEAVDGDEVRVMELCQLFDLSGEDGEVLADGDEQAGEAMDGVQVSDLDPGGGKRLVGEEGGEAVFGGEVREQVFVVGFEEREIGVDAVDEASGVDEELFPYGDEDGEELLGAISWRADEWQGRVLAEGDTGDGQSVVVVVGLIAAASGAAALGGPARVDLEDGEPAGGETAGEASGRSCRCPR